MILAAAALFCACSSENKPLKIEFSKDSSAIVFSQLEPVGLLQLKNKLQTDTLYQKLATVLQTPGDNDSTDMEKDWPGRLSLKGDELIFTPDTPFVKGKSYLVQTMLNTAFATKKDIFSSEVGHQVKPIQKVLVR